MLVVCPAKMKHGEKTWEQKVATKVGDIVFGAINANGIIKTYIGIERKPNDPSKRFPLIVVSAPELAEDILGDGGYADDILTISTYENPRDKTSAKSMRIDSKNL